MKPVVAGLTFIIILYMCCLLCGLCGGLCWSVTESFDVFCVGVLYDVLVCCVAVLNVSEHGYGRGRETDMRIPPPHIHQVPPHSRGRLS